MIYRYRMLSEVNEDFLREFEIQAKANFLDLHELIQNSVNFKGNELASFFICDGEWNRRTEITLLDMEEGEKEEKANLLMDKTSLMEQMNEPRQRIVYEYDFLNPKTFYIELKAIGKEEEGVEYPRCSFSVGEPEAPKPAEEDDISDEAEEIEDSGITEIDKLLRELGSGMNEEGDSEI